MKNKKARVIVEFDIQEKSLQKHGVTINQVIKNIVLKDHDIIDGFELTTDMYDLDNTYDFFLDNGKIISKEIVQDK